MARRVGTWEPVDTEEMRHIVAEELNRALTGQRLVTGAAGPPGSLHQVDLQKKHGSKLDKLLGGFTANNHQSEKE